MNSRKVFLSVFALFAAGIMLYSFVFFPSGYVGTTRKTLPPLGCVCHGDTATSTVNVQIIGPDSIPAGTTAFFRIKTSGGPAISGGFNLANYRDGGADTLTLSRVPNDTMVRKQEGELTHNHPKLFSNDTVSWIVRYTASSVTGYDTLYATSNSTNDSGSSEGDKWNWSQNKPVRIYNPIGIINLSTVAQEFSISQNYPNPFNPVTQINFSVAKASDIKIRIFDILGNEIAVPVNQRMTPGQYRLDYNGANLSSGTYFYSLTADGKTISTRKMLLVK